MLDKRPKLILERLTGGYGSDHEYKLVQSNVLEVETSVRTVRVGDSFNAEVAHHVQDVADITIRPGKGW